MEALVEYLKKAVLEGETQIPTTFHDLACRVEGFIEVARVPGNFHVEARSTTQDISPSMANLSHIVHNLQFGEKLDPALKSKLPKKQQFLIHPMNGESFVVDQIHTAPQHHINVLTTIYEFDSDHNVKSYQFSAQYQVAILSEDHVPEAKFSYELSPVSVIVSQTGKPLYSFLTSLFAIIGGTFTVISLLDGTVETLNIRLKRSIGKLN